MWEKYKNTHYTNVMVALPDPAAFMLKFSCLKSLKIYWQVHFAVKISEAEAQPRLRRTWLQSAPSAISSQCQWRASQVARGVAEGYLAVSELTLGASR